MPIEGRTILAMTGEEHRIHRALVQGAFQPGAIRRLMDKALVPIANGLNAGQYIVIAVAEWGSNMASQVWTVFVNSLANENYTGIGGSAPYARKTVYDTVMMEACAAIYNANMTGGNNGGVPAANGASPVAPPVGSQL